jgi:hypothetical protein
MSNQIVHLMARAFAKRNDALRKAFAPDGTRCFLLIRKAHAEGFDKLEELCSGFAAEYGNRDIREDIYLDYATTDTTFRDTWARATHIGYGVPDELLQVHVYEIVRDDFGLQRDGTAPDGLAPTYKAFCRRLQKERYRIR